MCLRELSAARAQGVKVARLSTRNAGAGLIVASDLAVLGIDQLGLGVWCCSPAESGRRTTPAVLAPLELGEEGDRGRSNRLSRECRPETEFWREIASLFTWPWGGRKVAVLLLACSHNREEKRWAVS